jgi:hypothetical protein
MQGRNSCEQKFRYEKVKAATPEKDEYALRGELMTVASSLGRHLFPEMEHSPRIILAPPAVAGSTSTVIASSTRLFPSSPW